MKKRIFILAILVSAVTTACCSKKTNEAKTAGGQPSFYDTTWELEYISGPRIAFEGLYPETKPTLIFTVAEYQYGGNSSCNSYGGKFTLKDTGIHFGDAIKTMRFCEGGGEETFLNMLGKINKYAIDNDGKLQLLKDDIPMMRFKKVAKK
jgi:heat shock protein HslJ